MNIVGKESAAQLAALHAESFERPWDAREFERLLENPAAFAIVCSDGFILAWAIAGEGEVLTLAVSPSARRKGRGAGLVEAVCAAAVARGAETIHLEVAEDNPAARALYAKQGFAEVGRRPGYYGGAVNAVVMRRALPM